MDFSGAYTLKRRPLAGPMESAEYNTSEFPLDEEVAELGYKLMAAAVTFHKLHLKITGDGSYAAHKTLNELYDALPEHADNLFEGYQGAVERIIECKKEENYSNKVCNSVEEALSYIRELVSEINELQPMIPYSEIVNDLDTVKSTLNSAKYKLNFLK